MKCKGCGIITDKDFCSTRCKEYGEDTTIHHKQLKLDQSKHKIARCRYCKVTFRQKNKKQYTCGQFDCKKERLDSHYMESEILEEKECVYCETSFKQRNRHQYTCGDTDCANERRREQAKAHYNSNL